ncbi:MAG TPA: PH domain-containing protein [Planctomycetota bacterium]|nr:PH domain-containing protein [Planctomycetota bacterium]
MYTLFRGACERVLRIPADPSPPTGDAASARVFNAAPAYFKYRLVLWAIATGFASIVFVLVVGGINFSVAASGADAWVSILVALLSFAALVVFVLHALFTLAIVRLNYEKRWYVVTDRSLRVREGVVIVREMTITIANVQNLAVMQGPIQRALGIADLQVETAGGGSHGGNEHGSNLHTAFFRGIDNAQEVKALIQERLRKLKDAGLGDHDDHHAPAAVASSFLDALRAVHAEAKALRAAAR